MKPLLIHCKLILKIRLLEGCVTHLNLTYTSSAVENLVKCLFFTLNWNFASYFYRRNFTCRYSSSKHLSHSNTLWRLLMFGARNWFQIGHCLVITNRLLIRTLWQRRNSLLFCPCNSITNRLLLLTLWQRRNSLLFCPCNWAVNIINYMQLICIWTTGMDCYLIWLYHYHAVCPHIQLSLLYVIF